MDRVLLHVLSQGIFRVAVVPFYRCHLEGSLPWSQHLGRCRGDKRGAPDVSGVAPISPFQAGLGQAALELPSLCRPLASLGKTAGLLLSLGKGYFFIPVHLPKGPSGLLASLQDSGLEGEASSLSLGDWDFLWERAVVSENKLGSMQGRETEANRETGRLPGSVSLPLNRTQALLLCPFYRWRVRDSK